MNSNKFECILVFSQPRFCLDSFVLFAPFLQPCLFSDFFVVVNFSPFIGKNEHFCHLLFFSNSEEIEEDEEEMNEALNDATLEQIDESGNLAILFIRFFLPQEFY